MAYIGKSPTGSAVRSRYYYTATGGETSLSGADDNGKTLKFTDGEYVDVHLNGIMLVQGTDYGVGTANTISSLSALAANDIVEIVVYDVYNVAKINSEAMRNRWYFTATGGETSIGTSQISNLVFPANAEIDVKLNGVTLQAGTDYNTTSANTVGGLSALTAGQVVEIVYYEKFQLADTVSKAAGGTFGGDVTFDNNIKVDSIQNSSGTDAISIDSNGVVTKSVVPAWRLGVTETSYTTTGKKDLPINTTTSSDINSDNSTFMTGGVTASGAEITVPVTGFYQVNYVCRVDLVGSGNFQTQMAVNGTASGELSSVVDDPSGSNETLTTSQVLYLQANDTIKFSFTVSTDTSYHVENNSMISGILIG